jgi:hypothetical protein
LIGGSPVDFKVNRLSKYEKMKIALSVALTTLSLFGCFCIAHAFRSSTASVSLPSDRVLTILKSENLDFLVRRRQVTQVVLIRTSDSSWWDWVPYVAPIREALKEDGVLTANVSVYYGFDLNKLNEALDANAKEGITITLPEPEVLDFAVDLDSLKFRSLKTGMITRIGNVFRDETPKDKLQKDVKSAVEEFVSTPGAMPSKSEMLKEMGGLERMLSDAYNVKLKFD